MHFSINVIPHQYIISNKRFTPQTPNHVPIFPINKKHFYSLAL